MRRSGMFLVLNAYFFTAGMAFGQNPAASADKAAQKKLEAARIGEIIIIGGDAKSHGAIRKAINLVPGQICDEKAMQGAAKNLQAYDATIKMTAGKERGFLNIVVTVKGEADEKGKGSAKQSASLEQMIAEAMRNNPDVLVADAKVREAETEAHRVRIRVATDLQGVLAEIEIVEIGVKEALLRFNNTERLFENKVISREELSNAFLSYAKAKAELVAKQGKLPYLLGKSAGPQWKVTHIIDEKIQKVWEQNINDAKITDDEFIRRAALDILGRMPQPQEIAKFKSLPEATRRRQLLDELIQTATSPSGATSQPARVDSISIVRALAFLDAQQRPNINRNTPMTDKLRKALDTPVKLKADKMSVVELLAFVRSHLTGVNLLIRVHQPTQPKGLGIDFSEPLPLGAFLQYIEDESKCVFILRDYGIVVVAADETLPPGAVRVTDFWKQTRASETKAETKTAK